MARFLYLFILVFSVACQQSSGQDSTPQSPAPQRPPEPSQPPPQAEDAPEMEAPKGSARKVAIPYTEVARWGVGGVPAWPDSMEQLHSLVREGRYARLYNNPNPGEYLRRAPWYYGDGCYAKAAHMSALADKKGYPRPGKVVAFGGWATMRFKSPYLPGGAIWWNYHVVAAYHIDSKVYVLDPLIAPERALTVDEWVRAIAPRPEKISISFCDQNIYSPSERCIGGNSNGAYLGHLPGMLRDEYRSLQSLGYDPDTLL